MPVFHRENATRIAKEFNDRTSSLQALIQLYDVGSDGWNLHEACHEALVMAAARNAAQELQNWGRVSEEFVSSQEAKSGLEIDCSLVCARKGGYDHPAT